MIIKPIIPIWIIIFIFPLYWFFRSKNKFKNIRQLIILILIFLINLRFMIPKTETNIMTNNLDVLLVFDTTICMLANDCEENKTRLSKSKEDALNIVNELDGSRFSIVTFDNKSKILVPFTYDKKMIINSVKSLSTINHYYAYGSSLNLPYDNIYTQLEKSKDEQNQTIIFIFSDGEITNEENLKSYEKASVFLDNGAVFGYGTTSGGKMFVEDYFTGEKQYVQDETSYPYEDAISKIDEKNLKNIAHDLKISYINMNNNSDISDKIKEIRDIIIYDINEVKSISYEDIYYIFVIPLFGLLFYEFINFKKEFK